MHRSWLTALGVSLVLVTFARSEEAREWTDFTGKQKITARFVSVNDTAVTLLQDGKKIQLPLRGLSNEDMEYLAGRFTELITFEEIITPPARGWCEAEFDRVDRAAVRLFTTESDDSTVYKLAPDAQLLRARQAAALGDFQPREPVLAVYSQAPSQEFAGRIHWLHSLATPSADRVWTSGKYTFEGRLAGIEGDSIQLRAKQETGKVRTVPFAALSEPDRHYIYERVKELGIAELAPQSQGKHVFDAPAKAFVLGGSKCWSKTWRDRSGKEMEAQLTSIKEGRAALQAGGRTVRVPIADLSAEDQAYIDKALTKGPPLSRLSYVLAGAENWEPGIRQRIIDSMNYAVGLYNEVGRFDNIVIRAEYNPGVPTAQGSIDRTMTFGGSIGPRVALHEIGHCLGAGTHHRWEALMQNGVWTGPAATAQLRKFDGPDAVLRGDRMHFWPYGMNYDNESSPENDRRHVLMVMALRHDMGM